jgi:hypothetical protein
VVALMPALRRVHLPRRQLPTAASAIDAPKIIATDPAVAPIVSKLFEWYATGQYSLQEVASKARDAGFVYRETGARVPVSACTPFCETGFIRASLSGTAS